MNRNQFLKMGSLGLIGLSLTPTVSWSDILTEDEMFFKISLAQWSLHRTIQKGLLDPQDFPIKARKDFDIDAVEYVNQFFMDRAKDKLWLADLKAKCRDNDVKSLLIMIDGEGALAGNNDAKRKEAVENHYKWVEAAEFLGCHSIRVNLHGEGEEEEWKEASVKSLTQLTNFAADHEVNVIVENHGHWSSKGSSIAEIMKRVDLEGCGTLPDFGNFCVRRRDGDMWESPCVETYDKYKGVDEMMPFAKGVSSKAFEFDENGNEPNIDFKRMLEIVKKHQFNGYVGIEYEGDNTDEDQGIRNTIALLQRVGREVSKG